MVRSSKPDHQSGNDDGPPPKKSKPEGTPKPEEEKKEVTPKKDEKVVIFKKRRLTPDFKLLRHLHLHVVPSREQRDGTYIHTVKPVIYGHSFEQSPGL